MRQRRQSPIDTTPKASGATLSTRVQADAEPTNNLPTEASSFVGRDQQLEALADQLKRSRLLTLTGPGGIGKTRLALRLAHRMRRAYAGGAYFVDLGPISDPALVRAST